MPSERFLPEGVEVRRAFLLWLLDWALYAAWAYLDAQRDGRMVEGVYHQTYCANCIAVVHAELLDAS